MEIDTVDSADLALDDVAVEAPDTDFNADADVDEGSLSDLDILNQDDAPVDPAEPPKVDEPAPVEAPKEEPKTEVKDDEQKIDQEELPATVKALRDALDKNPTLKAELNKPENAGVRNMLYANARRSQELNEFRNEFKTIELAKTARESAQALEEIEGAYTSGAPEGIDALLQRMVSLEMDDKGQQKMDEYGQPISFLQKFFTHQRQNHFWPFVEQLAKQNLAGAQNDDEKQLFTDLNDAISLVKQFIGDGQQPAPAQPQAQPRGNYGNLPQDVQAKLAEYDNLKRQQGQTSVDAVKQYETSVVSAVQSDVRGHLSQRVEKLASTLSPAIKKRIIDDAYSEVAKIAKDDTLYQSSWARAYRASLASRSDEAKAQLVNQSLGYAKNVAGPIIQRLVREFSSDAIQANQATHEKLKEQQKRAEVKSAGGVTPPRQGDVTSMIREAEKLSRLVNKRSLTDAEILDVEDILPKLQRNANLRR